MGANLALTSPEVNGRSHLDLELGLSALCLARNFMKDRLDFYFLDAYVLR